MAAPFGPRYAHAPPVTVSTAAPATSPGDPTAPLAIRAHVAALRDLVVRATDFSEPADYFYYQLICDPVFMNASEEATSALLQQVVARSMAAALPPGTAVVMLMVRHPPSGLLHGSGTWPGGDLNYFYFEDMGVGLVTIQTPDDLVRHIRITSTGHAPRRDRPTAICPRGQA